MRTPSANRLLIARLGISASAAGLALVGLEIALRVFDQPRFLTAHQESARFVFTGERVEGMPVYRNVPGRITFVYDGNPRGYFGPLNELHHDVNPAGFRGPDFGPKAAGARRLLFLGDSFTFGEGVRYEDTYPQVTARHLAGPGAPVESCNLGVGGYNTTQSAMLLDAVGFAMEPDAVILGYVPNDAEPPLFAIDPATGDPVRRDREALVEAEAGPRRPPRAGLYRLRLAQLVWQLRTRTRLSKQTVAYYRSLYAPDQAGWQESERALRAIVESCHRRGVPCIVVMFPILHDLSRYPFVDIHDRVGDVVRDAGGTFIDLLPSLEGQRARTLWVHPTDQHPNERVHAIAGAQLARALGD